MTEIDLTFLGEQNKRLRGDVRTLRSDMAQVRADSAKVESDIAALKADLTSIKNDIDVFRETVDDRLDQQIELIKPSFRTLSQGIQFLKKN